MISQFQIKKSVSRRVLLVPCSEIWSSSPAPSHSCDSLSSSTPDPVRYRGFLSLPGWILFANGNYTCSPCGRIGLYLDPIRETSIFPHGPSTAPVLGQKGYFALSLSGAQRTAAISADLTLSYNSFHLKNGN